ncbi:MAG: hypothetical protein ACLQNE_26980 [Thermoguttaceae bacterium]
MKSVLPRVIVLSVLLWAAAGLRIGQAAERPELRPRPDAAWDTFSDTWAATDALGRRVPTYEDVGPPRADRVVGIFYFLWHGAHVQGGPYDVTKILAQDPQAMLKKQSPLWGPMLAPHHWGQSIFGYYLTDDAGVLRKHAQMLADAGVDMVVFDVTNQITYKSYYMALLRVFSEVRKSGGRTPQVAFLCPFGDPAKVVAELYKDLYAPGFFADIWFRWEGKPLILADAEMLGDPVGNSQQNTPAELAAGHTLGQSFTVGQPVESVGGRFPTWATRGSAMTLTLFAGNPTGKQICSKRFEDVSDNAWLSLRFDPPLPPGTYYLQMSRPAGKVGWWSHTADVWPGGQALADGKPVAGDRTLRIFLADGPGAAIRRFFTFRAPQPDYFRGPTKPDMWSWAEVYPQHVFRNSRGEKEQMSVTVAQNAVDGRVGSMSEPGARGRSFHNGAVDRRRNAVLYGHNVAEQWERALKEDPKFIFITGWNEWFAGRYDEFAGIRQPVMFVDEFDQEHSRDIEPMQGGHGDNYYYQMVSYIRRYKGARPLPAVTPAPIRIDGRFDDWAAVGPEFRDTIDDAMRRNHPGYGSAGPYVDHSGRNDIVAAKVSWDENNVYFYVRTRRPLSPHTDANWMLLFLDVDHNPASGWLGYDFVVNRVPAKARTATLERNLGGYRWGSPLDISYGLQGNELEVAVPRPALGLKSLPAEIDFKWADNIQQSGEAGDFTLHGDVAPNDRFNYRAKLGSRVPSAPRP